MLSVGNRVVAASLCALLSTSPLVGYASEAQKADNAAAKMEETLTEVLRESEDAESQGKKVPYSQQGTYTVTLAEGDFRDIGKGKDEKAKAEEKKAAEEKALEDERAAADAMAREEKAADAKALEDAKSALEGAKSARDEAQRALDARTEDEKVAETEKAKAETQKTEAEKQAQDVETQKAEAEKKAKEAETQKAEADKKAQEAENLKAEAEKQAQEAENQKAEAEKQAQEAGGEMEAQDAEAQNAGGEMESKEAEAQKAEAAKKAQDAENLKAEAEKKAQEAETLKAEAEKKAEEAEGQSAAADEAKQSAEDAAKAVQEKAEAHDNAVKARKQAEEELSKAEEAVKVAEQKVAELERGAAQADASSSEARKENKAEGKAENKDESKAEGKDESKTEGKDESKAESKDENKDESKAEGKKAFADVRLEDVKVYYSVLANRAELEADESGNAEPRLERREARVNALANDNGAITLSFTDPDAASNATGSYAVEIEAMGKCAQVVAESAEPQLSAESDVKADSESCDVTIRAEGATFAAGLNAADLRLGGSFADMQVTGAEASGDALVVHLSGRPKMDYDLAGYVTDGQVIVPASGFEGSAFDATAFVDVKLPDEAYDLGGAEALPAATATGEVEQSTIEGDTGRATVYLNADLGEFKDVGPESIALDDDFAGGKVESVTKEGEDGELLKVELTFPASGQEADDHALAGTVRLAAGAMDDESGNAAPEIETTVALAPSKADDKKSEEDKKKEEEKKKKEREEKSKTLKSYGDGFTYASDKLKKVDPTIAEIAKFYGEALNLASNIAAGKYLDAIKSVEGLLKICGIIEPDAKEVTAADVLEEVKALRMVVEAIDRKIDVNTEENRADRYTQAFIRLSRMQSNCNRLRGIYEKGAKILATRKDNPMKAPAKGASKEEVSRYNNELRRVITQECDKQNAGKDKGTPWAVKLKSSLAELDKDLFTLSGWVSIDKNAPNAAANPINLLDKLVSTKVNWDSQGYYARAAFRTELQYTMLTSWAFLATYYDYSDPDIAKQEKTTAEAMAAALKQIQARPAGMSPDEVRKLNRAGKDVRVYSPTLGITVKRTRLITKGGKEVGLKNFLDVSDKKIDDYVRRLRGVTDKRNNIQDDLKLAGLDATDTNYTYVGFRHRAEQGYWTDYEGTQHYKEKTDTVMRNPYIPAAHIGVYTTYNYLRDTLPKRETKEYFKAPFMWFDRA